MSTTRVMMRLGAFWAAAFLVGLGACSGKQRNFGELSDDSEVGSLQPGASGAAGAGAGTPGDPTLPGPVGNTGVPPRSPGAACVTSADCDAPTPNAPAACVDGVCCTSACNELCAACNVPGSLGTCSAAPSDEACGTLVCAGVDTECRSLDTTQLSLNCEGFGTCKVDAGCAAVTEASGAPCQSSTGACDGAGACLVAGKASLGAPCAGDAECAEGHCVAGADGVSLCCDAACDGACQACSAAGHCEETPATDVRCEAVACPPDDVCNDYTAEVTASQCRSFGQCQTGRDCPATPLRPAGECECDAATGACHLRGGAACTAATECASGICGQSGQGAPICCAAACAAGQFCSADGSACVACEGDAITCDGNTEQRCVAGAIQATACPSGCTAGAGCNALPTLGLPCNAAGQCAVPNVCQPDLAGAARCCARDCAAEGKVCDANGSCICQAGQVAAGNDCLFQDGDRCDTTAQCQPGSTCTDGVCCQEACNGACETCQPNTGLCVAISRGLQDPTCANGRECTGTRGDCRLTLRQQCTGNAAECTTNACEPTVGNATQICCGQACNGALSFCRSDGSGCVQCETNADCGNGCNTFTGQCNALLPVGALCGASPQCAAGPCILDQSSLTRCCESNCGAQGLVCNSNGRCVAPTVGAGQNCTPGVVNCAGSLQCINGTCQLPTVGAGAACGAQANCDGRLGLQCLGGVCNCPVNETLSNGRCALVDGRPCQSANECASGTCTRWLADADGDGFGSEPGVNGHPAVSICGDNSPANRPPPFVAFTCRAEGEIQYEADLLGRTDCCDNVCPAGASPAPSSATVFPGQRAAGTTAANCAPGVTTLDFNCDGQVTLLEPDVDVQPACSAAPTAISAAECSLRSGFSVPAQCGVGRSRQSCSIRDGVCAFPPAAGPPPIVPSCL